MNRQQKYIDFLKSKIEIAPEAGYELDVPMMKFADGTELKHLLGFLPAVRNMTKK